MFVFARFVPPPIFGFSALLAEAISPRINLASLREFITLRHFFSYARAYCVGVATPLLKVRKLWKISQVAA